MAESCVIIGLGQIGMGYDVNLPEDAVYTHARAISQNPDFKLSGAVEVSAELRSVFKNSYGLNAFDAVESAMKQLQPSIVVIATSTNSHYSILMEVVKTCNPKLILCEKPLSNNIKEAKEMVAICEKTGISLFVNYIRRADPGVIEVKRRLESCWISTPVKGTAWYSKGILNNGSHFLNLLEFWLGDVKRVNILNAGRLWDGHDPEPDFEVQYELGNIIFRSAWEEEFSHYAIELLSKVGRLRYEQGGELIEWQAIYSDPNFKGYNILNVEKEIISNGMHTYQLHIYNQIRDHLVGKSTTMCTGYQALKSLEVIDLIIKQRLI